MDFPALSLSIHFFGLLYSAQIKLGWFLHSSIRPSLGPKLYSQVKLLRIKRLTCPRWYVYEYEVLRLFRKKNLQNWITVSEASPPPPPQQDQINNYKKYLVQPTFLSVNRRMCCLLFTLKLLSRSVKNGALGPTIERMAC